MRVQSLFPLLLLTLSLPAAAQLTPLGTDFPVNAVTATPLHDHDGAVVALSSTDVTLAVWTVPVSSVSDELWARAFDATGQPLGPGRRIDTGNFLKVSPAAVALPDGRFAVAWTTSALVPGAPRRGGDKIGPVGFDIVSLRLLDATGVPSSAEIRVDSAGESSLTLRLAAVAGGLAVAWSEYDVLANEFRALARRFDTSGVPLGNEFLLDSSPACTMSILALAGRTDGGLAAFWRSGSGLGVQASCPGISDRTRRFAADGSPAVGPLTVPSADLFAVRPDGSYLAVRNKLPPPGLPVASGLDVFVQLYDENGIPLGGESSLTAPAPGNQQATDAVAGEDGSFVVVWSDAADVTAQLLDATGHGAGSPTPVNAQTAGDQFAPYTATDGHGGWVFTWVSGPAGQSSGDLFARRFSSAAPCASALCLHGGRFGVDVAWRDPRSGRTGTGHGVSLAGDSGAFWFFAAENVELFVKVLDGSAVNQHFWVFFGALSDVEFTLTVTDTATGAFKSYHNPPYVLASHADILAFPASAAGTASVFSSVSISADVADVPDDAACSAGNTALCLNSRFQVSVSWTDPRTGVTGSGQAVPLSRDSGYFWFFNAGSVEMVVKVLDGRPVNGHFWVFDASLSDVETEIRVTDTASGAFKIYRKPPYTFLSQADTSAF